MNGIDAYRNLRNGLWSIRSRKTGRVTDHAASAIVVEPRLIVQPAGRERVRREGRKNVHAFVRGHGIYFNAAARDVAEWSEQPQRITYNPYVNDGFVWHDTQEPVDDSAIDSVYLRHDGTAHAWRDLNRGVR